jgi:hypothetical protein
MRTVTAVVQVFLVQIALKLNLVVLVSSYTIDHSFYLLVLITDFIIKLE